MAFAIGCRSTAPHRRHGCVVQEQLVDEPFGSWKPGLALRVTMPERI
jgi:hypothetical protein